MSRSSNYPNSCNDMASERIPKRFRAQVRHFIATMDRLNTNFEVQCTFYQDGKAQPSSVIYTVKGYQELAVSPTTTLPVTPVEHVAPSTAPSIDALLPEIAPEPESGDALTVVGDHPTHEFGAEADDDWLVEPLAGPSTPPGAPATDSTPTGAMDLLPSNYLMGQLTDNWEHSPSLLPGRRPTTLTEILQGYSGKGQMVQR